MKQTMLFFLISAFWNNIQAQDTSYVSLDRLLLQVETNYPSILQYQQNIKAIEATAGGAKAWMPPTFSTGLMQFPYNLSMLNDRNDPMNQAGIVFALEQMIPSPSKLNAKQSYLNSLAEIEKNKSDWTKNTLRREAKILYYQRYVTERKQQIIEDSKELLNLLISTSEARYSYDQSQLSTIYKAKARLAELNNMLLMLNGLIAESNIGLNTLMIRDLNTSFEIDTSIIPSFYAAGIVDTGVISLRSDITAVSSYIQSMRLEQKVMKLGVRPDFGIRLEHAQMFGMPNQWSIMGMITLPIVPWSSKMYSAEVSAIGYQIQAMEQERLTMELMAGRMLQEKLIMLKYENQQYENYRNEIIPAFENNMEANLLAYKQNTGNLFVLLDAWEMLLMKKLEMYDKLFNILKLEAEYDYERETN